MSIGELKVVVEELTSAPGALAGIEGSKTYTAADVPVELDPATLPKEIVGELLRARGTCRAGIHKQKPEKLGASSFGRVQSPRPAVAGVADQAREGALYRPRANPGLF